MEEGLVPQKLYRGIRLSCDMIASGIKWHDVPLRVHYEPHIDANGRKIVSDGNEYGVYMSDNILVADLAYSKVADITPSNLKNVVDKDLTLMFNMCSYNIHVALPEIGIIYEIDTTGLNVRKPWISMSLNAVYNNGFSGNEWIADEVPISNYRVKTIKVGADLLHDQQIIEVSDILSAEQELWKIMRIRRQHLKDFCEELRHLPQNKRDSITRTSLEVYKLIFGYMGVKYVDYSKLDLHSGQDYCKFLISEIYRKNPEEAFEKLSYIHEMTNIIGKESTTDEVMSVFQKAIIKNNERISKLQNMEKYHNIDKYEQKNDFVKSLMKLMVNKQQSANNIMSS